MKPQGPHPDGIDEGPSAEDVARFGGETVPCPECRAPVHDESEWCHKCGHAMGDPADEDDAPMSKKAIIVAVIVFVAIGLLFARVF